VQSQVRKLEKQRLQLLLQLRHLLQLQRQRQLQQKVLTEHLPGHQFL
jgi:hypothetical protein